LQARGTVAIGIIAVGIVLVAFDIDSILTHSSLFGNVLVFGAVGVILIVVGALLLITELMENWLTKGQAALVDGLQAG
jgi:uncharacterized membrane protein YidH (DUF202 family)